MTTNPSTPPVRMREIARELGVDASTVSRALRGDPRIGVGLSKTIRSAAERLGYRPNPLVSALMANRRRGKTADADVVALVTCYDGEDWRQKDVCRWEYEGIRRRAAHLGFRLEVFALEDYGGNAARLERTLRARGIVGVLLGFAREGEQPVEFNTEGFAMAGLSAYFRSAPVDRANFHGFFNVQLALERMHAAGYRRLALAVPEFNNAISNNQWSGAFLDWQRRVPADERCELFIPGSTDDFREFQAWMERNRPDALLAYKVPAARFLARLGRKVPTDVGLAFLYRTAAEMQGAAGIDGNLGEVGAAAFDLVVERLNTNRLGATVHPKEVLIKGTWHGGPTLPVREERTPPASKQPVRRAAATRTTCLRQPTSQPASA